MFSFPISNRATNYPPMPNLFPVILFLLLHLPQHLQSLTPFHTLVLRYHLNLRTLQSEIRLRLHSCTVVRSPITLNPDTATARSRRRRTEKQTLVPHHFSENLSMSFPPFLRDHSPANSSDTLRQPLVLLEHSLIKQRRKSTTKPDTVS